METFTTKQLQRLQRKKAKITAFLEIAKLNDKDKEIKLPVLMQANTSNESSDSSNNETAIKNSNHKRHYNEEIENANSEECNKKEDKLDSQVDKKPRLHGEDYIKLKQELKDRKKRLKSIPRLTLKEIGENAVINIENIGKRIPIFLSDVQHLLLYSLLGQVSPYSPTRWCKLEKYNKISHIVVLVVEGLSSYHFFANESIFSHVNDNLKYHLEVITPAMYGGSIAEELVAVPLTGTQSDKLIKRYGCLETALQMNRNIIKLLRTTFQMPLVVNNVEHAQNNIYNNDSKQISSVDKFCRTKLLLSLEQMVEENYPVPLKGILIEKFSSYILTKDSYEAVTATSPMFALDCEMCLTTTGNLELTRISIINESLNIVYNTLVKPENTIINYLTRYSGITEEMLKDVTVTLQDVQQTLRRLLPADAILVGHSLNCDLHSLKMMHPYNIDTSVIFNLTGNRFKKSKLQTLAREFLGEEIQNSKAGHCSVEDSKATMKLVKLKLANDLNYGDMVLLGHHNVQTVKMETDKMSRKTMQKTECKKYAMSIFNHITKNKNTTAAIIGREEIMSEYARYLNSSSLNIMDDKNFLKDDQVRLVLVNNDKHAMKRTSELAMEHDFILCHVKITDKQLQDDTIEKTLRKVNKRVGKLWQHSAVNSLVCVIFGGQDNTSTGTCFLNIKTEV